MIMDKDKFLNGILGLLQDIYFNKNIHINEGIITYSEIDKSSFWNYLLINKILKKESLLNIESKFKNILRTPTIYFLKEELKENIPLLEKMGYKKEYEDSWMFYVKEDVDETHFGSIRKVETLDDLEVFLDTSKKCYQKDDPQNPYGELGVYIDLIKKVWVKNHNSNKVEFFIAYKGNLPVAVSILNNYKNLGYISNVGSIREVRGEGYGKAISLYCVIRSRSISNRYHFLATEEGFYPNEFYKRIGFATKVNGIGMVKNGN